MDKEHWFWMIHNNTKREGPGLDDVTLKIWQSLTGKEGMQKGLDVGCGPGAQTLLLAQNTNVHWTAVDNHQPFLDRVKETSREMDLGAKITTVNASMFELPFKENEFDIIWSEGAIYIMGFENGLKAWQKYLKPKGYLVVSEISWFKPTNKIPEECLNFWTEEYPGMATTEENVAMAEKCAYRVVDTVTLPEAGWWEYYSAQDKNIERLCNAYPGNEELMQLVEFERKERNMYEKYSDHYGYVFYVLQKYN